ncbi:MAG: ABC transporter permease [Bacteroidota bacterium]|nr:ABC transporter permease [Bacteroidota bacterium]
MKYLRASLLPIIALALAFSLGALMMKLQGANPLQAYQALLSSAFGSSDGISKTLGKATPLIFSGLAVTICLRAGLFNIGVQGQLLAGALASAWAGYFFHDLPMFIHLPLALAFGIVFGSLTGIIAGALKAYRGVHEVITTIMLNSIVLQLGEYLSYGPFKEKGQQLARTAEVLPSAKIPSVFGMPLGFFISIALALFAWWVFKKTTSGFRLETVGRNKSAAWYAGISVKKSVLVSMIVGGGLAGLGGAIETLGVVGRYEPAFNGGLGFDGITIALLGRANPLALIPGAILFGGMRGAGGSMQFSAGVSPDIIDLILAIVLFFVTAPLIGKWFKSARGTKAITTGGWGN